MPNIFKGFLKPNVDPLLLEDALALDVGEPPPGPEPAEAEEGQAEGAPPRRQADPRSPVDYARVQADAILADARQQAQELLEREQAAAREELDRLREEARQEGYQMGLAEGMAGALAEARDRVDQQAAALEREVRAFLEEAARARDGFIDRSQDELVDLALAVAEKVVQVSLQSSRDIVGRMIQSATEKLRRKEWVRIYIADCDTKGVLQIPPGLTASLASLSDHVRIIPMGDDEPGTCVIEMPDEIIDASVSTQMANIREILRESRGGT